ncbi:MAG: AAA family ATPase [Lachnospiraceae bacterium]|nr:AAA family ATPase [Lachnospiraceae bacterium]
MGVYLNPGYDGFKKSLRSEIYIDKSGLIAYTNSVLDTEQQSICVSRPRRFGKSMAAKMLTAYYDCSVDSSELFQGLSVTEAPSFEEHLNKYDVVSVNMLDFLSMTGSVEQMLECFQENILDELEEAYGDILQHTRRNILTYFSKVYAVNKRGFVIIIDEWDCIFRYDPDHTDGQKQYLDFLRLWLKDKNYVKLAYLTGILPIKKYGVHSGLNMFEEFSMLDAKRLGGCFGFVESEVRELCSRYQMDFSEIKRWYDGYRLKNAGHVYSPKSVVDAMRNHDYHSYWNSTETYEALRIYLDMNFDGLKDSIVRMIADEKIRINSQTFQNDMKNFATKDDVLTLLVHLGYLAYESEQQSVYIPNEEIRQEFINAIEISKWTEVMDAVKQSDSLLQALWNGDEEAVAAGIARVHQENTSILQYNNENSLSCVVSLAFYSARDYYTIHREMPAGKGFADLVFLPRSIHREKPAIIIELKWDKDAEAAIQQIKKQGYVHFLQDYSGDVILAGINYDKKKKEHSCRIDIMPATS